MAEFAGLAASKESLPSRAKSPLFDVVGLGCVAVDDLLYVQEFPVVDSKTQVVRRERQCGGLAATALVAAARLGAKAAYAGVLGDDPLSEFAREAMDREGVSLDFLRRQAGLRPIHSTIVVEIPTGARTILFDLNGVVGSEGASPPEETIRRSKVLLVDMLGAQGMLRAARIARQAQVPIVADFESEEFPEFAELLSLVDHLILSEAFALRITGAGAPAEAAQKLFALAPRELVAITCGERGYWWISKSARAATPIHEKAFRVTAIDTTGCGDVFHGAYAAELARGLRDADCLRIASGAAALKATRSGAQAGAPTRAELDDFLRAQGA